MYIEQNDKQKPFGVGKGWRSRQKKKKKKKQVAQRATIPHLIPMCQGQILFKKSGDTDVLDAQGQLTP